MEGLSRKVKRIITKKKVKEIVRSVAGMNIEIYGGEVKKINKTLPPEDFGIINTIGLYEGKEGNLFWSYGNKGKEVWRFTGLRVSDMYYRVDRRTPLVMKNLGVLDEEVYKGLNNSTWATKKRRLDYIVNKEIPKVKKYLGKVSLGVENRGEHDYLLIEYDIENGLPKEIKDVMVEVSGERLSELWKDIQRNRDIVGNYVAQVEGEEGIARLAIIDDYYDSWKQTLGLAVYFGQMVKTGEVDYKMLRSVAQKELPKYIEDKVKEEAEISRIERSYN